MGILSDAVTVSGTYAVLASQVTESRRNEASLQGQAFRTKIFRAGLSIAGLLLFMHRLCTVRDITELEQEDGNEQG